jgi:hypothetical protein
MGFKLIVRTTAPAAEAIEYHDVVFKRDFGPEARLFSDYAGWPSDDLDQKWDELYYRGFAAIDAESHEHLLNKSVNTPVEGFQDTYMVTLDVFHELYCLVKTLTWSRSMYFMSSTA